MPDALSLRLGGHRTQHMAVIGDGGSHCEKGEEQDDACQHAAAAQKYHGVQPLFLFKPRAEFAGTVDSLLPFAQQALPQTACRGRQQSPEHQQRLQCPPVGLREPVGLGLPDHPAAAAAEPAALLSGPEPKPAPEILRLRQHSALPAGLYGVLRFGDAGAFRPVIFFFSILTHSPPGMIKQSK